MTLQQVGDNRGQFVTREVVNNGIVITPIGDYVEAYLMKELGILCYLPGNPITEEVRPVYGYVLEVHTSRIHPGVENVEFRVSGPATAEIMQGRKKREFLRLRPVPRLSTKFGRWFALGVNGEVFSNTTRQPVSMKPLEPAL